MSKNTAGNKSITLRYSLFDLPTAQHKAGLAGLLVMIETMRRRGIDPRPEISGCGPNGVTVSLTPDSLQTLCDDLFDAEIVEIKSKSKWQGGTPKRIIEVSIEQEGKEKKEKRFVYDLQRPKGLFLQDLFPDGNGAWVELWRSMLWNVLRAQPKTRKVYEERIGKEHSSVAGELYNSLVKEQQQKAKGKKVTEGIAGSVFIGAQSKNAESVSFTGIPSENFLLHFWHIVALTFVPRTFSFERSKEQAGRIKWDDYGFALVIPEPAHLEDFLENIIDVLQSLDARTSGRRPQKAIIDLHQEGGLEYLYALTLHRARQSYDCVTGVEIYHIQKQGNNVRMLAAERIVPDEMVLQRYGAIRISPMNPLFKQFYLQSILQGNPWYQGALDILANYPVELLVSLQGKTPKNMHYFSVNANKKFHDIQMQMNTPEEDMSAEENRDELLAIRVYKIVRNYVGRKAESRSKLRMKEFPKDGDGKRLYPKDYREAVEKVCLDAFLAMRGRREQDFVEYFTGTLCAVPHYLPEEDFLLVSQALINEPDKVKTLAMLAVSAASYLPQNKQNKQGE
jgi:CRISPR-associated protein Cmx8